MENVTFLKLKTIKDLLIINKFKEQKIQLNISKRLPLTKNQYILCL